MNNQYEQEENDIHESYERGEITMKELREALRDLNSSFRQYAEEAAQEAHDNVMFGRGDY